MTYVIFTFKSTNPPHDKERQACGALEINVRN